MNKIIETLPLEGILLVDKPSGRTSFSLVSQLRKTTGVQKIGHAGTLDPFATGLMILLIGKKYTRQSDHYLHHNKEYQATLHLGIATDTFDIDGTPTAYRETIPSLSEIENALLDFQGKQFQIPPMFSAKKIQGKKLYELARQGISIERPPVEVTLETILLHYNYPLLQLLIRCSKGTYIRSLGHDLGEKLGCGAHLKELRRLRSGQFHIDHSLDGTLLNNLEKIKEFIRE